jgi:hypothetical protein
VANPTTRVANVAAVSGNDVNVEMSYRLTGHLANVDTDVETVWCVTTTNLVAGGIDCSGKRLPFRNGRVEPAAYMATSN